VRRGDPGTDAWLGRLPEVAAFLESQLISVAASLDEYQDLKSINARLQETSRRLVVQRNESRRKRGNGQRRLWVLALLEQIDSNKCTGKIFEGRRTRSRYAMVTTSALLTKLSQLDKFVQRHIVEFL
jgi:hypothetical protein